MIVSDMRDRAERVLSPEAWDYLETGCGAERGLREAQSAWRSWRFRPRVLRDVSTVSTTCTLFGSELATPVLAAPTACHAAYHSTGEVGTATGLRDAGSLLCLSTRSTCELEDVAAVGAPWWMQVYVTVARDITEAMVQRAAEAGATALVLTGDTPYVSERTRGVGGYPVSEESASITLRRHLGGRPDECLLQDPSITTSEIAWLADCSGLPVLVKGVLRADDAEACVDAGAAGIVVSNHGARQVDGDVTTAAALPEVVDAVGDQVPVVVDGGIRTGTDVVVALALGAAAVMVGRPTMYGLACGGASGVAELVGGLTEETADLMGLLGAASLPELDRSLVAPAPGWG